jgi:drug/metabolite transporter (DMT)-like permease
VGCLAFINSTLTVLTRLGSSDHDRHHIFDNISGNIIFGFRLIILIVFVCAIVHTYKISRTKVKQFIVYFGIIGGIYIFATPIIVFFGNKFIAAKDRH